jgi:hypothetical protein
MGFALGLLVLWELGVVPVPLDPNAGPIARAAIAIVMAVIGALVAFGIQAVFTKLFGRPKTEAGDRDG